MADNNQQVEKPELDPQTPKAQKEFEVILDVLKVPLRTDGSNQKLPPHRGWRGGCLLELKYPDLVPINPNPDDGPEGVCRKDDQGRLIVMVGNQGDEDAPRSVTRVVFSPGGSFNLDTPPIEAGDSVELPPFAIPADCFDSGDCEFQIIVDATNQVVESEEGNNTLSGKCKSGEVE